MRFVFLLLARLPLSVLYRLGDAIFFIAHRMIRWRHAVAMVNLARAFPDKSAAERAAILEQS